MTFHSTLDVTESMQPVRRISSEATAFTFVLARILTKARRLDSRRTSKVNSNHENDHVQGTDTEIIQCSTPKPIDTRLS